jgi:Flavin containing amine oxidoreductase
VGVALLPYKGFGDYSKQLLPSSPAELAEVEAAIERIKTEQKNPRPATLPELDDQSFADWLGPMSTGAAAYFDTVYELMHGACTVELSLYGGLWVWGDQRSTPWSTEDIPRHGRGELIVSGGTGQLAHAVARAVGGRVSLRTRARRVTEESDGYSVEVEDESGVRMLHARRIICAVPAPIAIDFIAELPGWKRAALRAVRYGRWISTPIVVSPAGRRRPATRSSRAVRRCTTTTTTSWGAPRAISTNWGAASTRIWRTLRPAKYGATRTRASRVAPCVPFSPGSRNTATASCASTSSAGSTRFRSTVAGS